MIAKHLVLAGLASLCACAASKPLPAPPADSELARCVQDAEHAFAVLQHRHPDLFARNSRARFEEILRRAHAQTERREVFFDLMQLVALGGDSHTRVGNWEEIEDIEMPVRFESWSDGFWIAAVQSDRAELFGRKLVAIEGRAVDEAVDLLAPLVPHENAILLRRGAARLLSLPRALVRCGLAAVPTQARLTLEDATGSVSTITVESRPRSDLSQWAFVVGPEWKAPLYRMHRNDDWWWCSLDGGTTLYLQYNHCVHRPDAPFDLIATQCLTELDRGTVERFVIDLRLNGGGDSRVLRPLLDGLVLRRDALARRRVFVLIGAETYSSGLMNAVQLARLGAELAGEPSGQKPDCFGEVRSTRLPNTGWVVDCSTKQFRLANDDRPSIAPDHPIANGFADLCRGRDPVLDWVRTQRR